MEYFIVAYRVDVDGVNHYGKAGVASKDLHSDWEEVKSKIRKGY